MRLADSLHVGCWWLLLGEVRNYWALKWAGTLLCLFVAFLYKPETTLLLLSCTVSMFTLKIYKLYEDLGKGKRAISFNTCRKTHTHTHAYSTRTDWESLLLPSQSPKWATFPCSTSCSNGSLQRRGDTVINQRTQRHSNSAADAQHRSTLIEENYLNVTAEDKLQGSMYLYKLL